MTNAPESGVSGTKWRPLHYNHAGMGSTGMICHFLSACACCKHCQIQLLQGSVAFSDQYCLGAASDTCTCDCNRAYGWLPCVQDDQFISPPMLVELESGRQHPPHVWAQYWPAGVPDVCVCVGDRAYNRAGRTLPFVPHDTPPSLFVLLLLYVDTAAPLSSAGRTDGCYSSPVYLDQQLNRFFSSAIFAAGERWCGPSTSFLSVLPVPQREMRAKRVMELEHKYPTLAPPDSLLSISSTHPHLSSSITSSSSLSLAFLSSFRFRFLSRLYTTLHHHVYSRNPTQNGHSGPHSRSTRSAATRILRTHHPLEEAGCEEPPGDAADEYLANVHVPYRCG